MPTARFVGYNAAANHAYTLPDVKWVLAFMGDYTIHGAYWRQAFGTPGSNGCVSLTDGDAQVVYNWATEGTLVRIHYWATAGDPDISAAGFRSSRRRARIGLLAPRSRDAREGGPQGGAAFSDRRPGLVEDARHPEEAVDHARVARADGRDTGLAQAGGVG